MEKFILKVKMGYREGDIIELREGIFTIGRKEDNDFVIPDSSVSRHHCEIKVEGDAASLIDKSTNGTYVNDLLINKEELPLKSGDTIDAGPCQFVIYKEGEEYLIKEETIPEEEKPRETSHTIIMKSEPVYEPEESKKAERPVKKKYKKSSYKPLVYGIAGVIIVVIFIAGWHSQRKKPNPAPSPSPTPTMKIKSIYEAFAHFKNLPDEIAEPLSAGSTYFENFSAAEKSNLYRAYKKFRIADSMADKSIDKGQRKYIKGLVGFVADSLMRIVSGLKRDVENREKIGDKKGANRLLNDMTRYIDNDPQTETYHWISEKRSELGR